MKTRVKKLEFRVLIEQDENGIYVASVPELVGCHTQGKTLKQVRRRIREVIELVLDCITSQNSSRYSVNTARIQ